MSPASANVPPPPPRWRRRARWFLRWLPRMGLLALAAAVAAWFLCPFREGRLRESQGNGALQVLDASGATIGWRVGRDGNWRLPVPLADVAPRFLAATIAAEDKRFYDHRGLDFLALARAVRQNLTHARRVSGASTLTMQTIRLLYPRDRTYVTKAREALAALQLEKTASKARILEAYCNLAPYGGNVIGVQAAALRYFGKNASQLTLGEAALLAGVPQSPTRFNPRKHLAAAMKRREFVLDRMVALSYITPAQAARARAENIVLVEPPNPDDRAVPGLVDWMAQEFPAGGVRRSTIDPATQKIAATAAAAHARRLKALGVDGLAVVVIDVRASSLAALVGNPAPNDPRHGQLNGALIRRQPGSLLKPFIYAAAYQRGVCTPDALVDDSPRDWGGYRPENMDHRFLGKIPAAEALRLSRNLPAVALLDAAGKEPVAAALRALGLPLPDAGRLGLSLALGTQEMRLVDLANAYAALARLGRWRPLRLTHDGKGENDDEQPAGARGLAGALSPAAAWLALRSLAEDPGQPAVWKTGTSWNHRDGWAVALCPRHVVGVWTGNWGGAGDGRLSGADAALPLAREIIDALATGETWPRPDGIQELEACATSGHAPGLHCAASKRVLAIAGVSPATVCAECRPAGDGTRAAGPHAATQGAKGAGAAGPSAAKTAAAAPGPKIVSPTPEGEYFLAPGAPATLPLQAEADGQVTWFVDGREAARTPPRAVHAWPMTPGAHRVTAVDAAGRAAAASFVVRKLN